MHPSQTPPLTTSTAKDPVDPSTIPEETEYFCAVCGGQYLEETDYVEKWIACDKCNQWSHWTCVGISEEPEEFICSSCVNSFFMCGIVSYI